MASSTSATASAHKVILLGDPGVGKTSLFLRLQKGEFVNTEMLSTLGVDYLEKEIDVDGKPVPLFVHDTGGGERFKTLTSNFYRNTQAVILVYSVEDSFTFDNLQMWVEECHNSLGSEEFKSLVWVVVGNKADEPRGQLTDDMVLQFCKQIYAKYSFETSAKTGENVMKMFQKVAEMVHKVHGNKQAAKMPKQHKHRDTTTNPIATPKRFCNII